MMITIKLDAVLFEIAWVEDSGHNSIKIFGIFNAIEEMEYVMLATIPAINPAIAPIFQLFISQSLWECNQIVSSDGVIKNL